MFVLRMHRVFLCNICTCVHHQIFSYYFTPIWLLCSLSVVCIAITLPSQPSLIKVLDFLFAVYDALLIFASAD